MVGIIDADQDYVARIVAHSHGVVAGPLTIVTGLNGIELVFREAHPVCPAEKSIAEVKDSLVAAGLVGDALAALTSLAVGSPPRPNFRNPMTAPR